MYIKLADFGNYIRKIRTELNFTQEDVSLLTGINTETLRRIEGGKVIPKFETLEYLSTVYKVDLNEIFLQYRIDDYAYFYELKNNFENKFDEDNFCTLEVELKELKSLIPYINSSYYKNLINQLIIFAEAIVLYKHNNKKDEAIKKLIEAMKITSPNFNLDTYYTSVYSSMEIRILMNIAFVLNRLDNRAIYIELLEFCFKSLDFTEEIFPKLCHNLSGAYRRNGDYEKALELSNLGIKSCQENRNWSGLNLLYYGKGISEYRLNKQKYMESFKTAIYLSKALGHHKLVNTIIHNCKNIYNIDLDIE